MGLCLNGTRDTTLKLNTVHKATHHEHDAHISNTVTVIHRIVAVMTYELLLTVALAFHQDLPLLPLRDSYVTHTNCCTRISPRPSLASTSPQLCNPHELLHSHFTKTFPYFHFATAM
jgi:hypothetical protein